MSGDPSTVWEREDQKGTRECTDAARQVAAEPTPRVWPFSGPDAGPPRYGRPTMTAKRIPTVETKDEDA
jgi:hypothetical protein